MKRILALLIFPACLIPLLRPVIAFAGEPADSTTVQVESKLGLAYLCTPDSAVLTATLSIRKGDYLLALENAPVGFFASDGIKPVALGSVKTDQEGNAVLKVAVAGLPADKQGVVSYSAKFNGTPKYPEAEASFAAKPAKIRLFFSVEDSLRILKVTATQTGRAGEETPVPDETVQVYVPRLFSLLKIGEISLDASGNGTMEFPPEIVGDTLGNLTVVARIEEHDLFGFVQGQNVINWGVHKQYYKAEVPSRELWTPIAPMWMIITLIIMLAGVWAHYLYAVYELVMIRLLSKKEK